MLPVYKNIIKELRVIAARSHKVHEKSNLAKNKAMLEYKKIQLIKQNRSIAEVDAQLKNLQVDLKPSAKFEEAFKQLFAEFSAENPNPTRIQQQHFKNVSDFLYGQRTYQELIERYNSGLGMDQSETVEKSANRVGFTVPQ
ncbi:hypothetical protein PSN45_004170 [Yamadazyma tenuis]|uniref:ATP synthase assembly factor FMC1, mitochondrial n=1 Tax=Candida tenuis (strain ATCC 10573 / BCRC 21748 / CBS 615 / JCM 9827 / NBRC 10315 / NRRL Y-1498 / VKM Y-70) TaxID=590646 RepID=G3B428_CANTC|nr:uncharacterized protein CANTEDRAFT_105191 [Yamadazyma tenuis ATCC 10573]EGV63758.1 hypothetical protein CANTEDRAFT_105191 [Yamadazyma tenuis ATCC 10573]WEJ96629.1 hypothetical protein PSN45_004170 [Yamadazyma tenuis]